MAKDETADVDPDDEAAAAERRTYGRFEVEWAVDLVADDTFLYASIANISEMGIFVRTTEPLKIGTKLTLSFSPPGQEPFKLEGAVARINKLRDNGDNPNPGMGVRFTEIDQEIRNRVLELVKSIQTV